MNTEQPSEIAESGNNLNQERWGRLLFFRKSMPFLITSVILDLILGYIVVMEFWDVNWVLTLYVLCTMAILVLRMVLEILKRLSSAIEKRTMNA